MSNDPAPGGEQPGWQGQQPYPGSYGQPGQRGEQPGYPGAYAPTQAGGYGQAPPWAQTPPHPGSGYPGGPAHGPAGMGGGGLPAGGAQSFFTALFDFNFNSFATPVVIKLLYILGLIGIAGAWVVYVIIAFSANVAFGLVVLVVGAVAVLFWVMLLRTTLEFYYALVRMSEDIRVMRNRQ